LDMAFEFSTTTNICYVEIQFSRDISASFPYPKIFGGEQF